MNLTRHYFATPAPGPRVVVQTADFSQGLRDLRSAVGSQEAYLSFEKSEAMTRGGRGD